MRRPENFKRIVGSQKGQIVEMIYSQKVKQSLLLNIKVYQCWLEELNKLWKLVVDVVNAALQHA
jgi:hypothetical protein